MAVLVHRPSHVPGAVSPSAVSPSAVSRRAWLALALVPLGWVVAVAAALIADPGLSTGLSTAAGVLVAVVALAAPTAAVILADLADLAEGAGEHSGRTAVLTSGALLFVTIVGLPRLVVSVPAFVIALVVCVVVLCVGLPLARRRAALR